MTTATPPRIVRPVNVVEARAQYRAIVKCTHAVGEGQLCERCGGELWQLHAAKAHREEQEAK